MGWDSLFFHYQWGRKDPFTPSSATSRAEVQIYKADGSTITKGDRGIATIDKQSEFDYKAIKTTINHLIQNPSTYYNKGDGTDNRVPIASTEYYNTTKEGDWWNPTIKTIYDPCPNGYRIPENGTYGNASDWILSTWEGSVLTAGHLFNTNNILFVPASGGRSYSNGQLSSTGTSSWGWMATTQSPINGSHLTLSSGYLNPSSSNSRSYGFPTRCIKE